MKIKKIKAMIPAAALLLAASITSCMSDLDKGNINPNVQATADINGLYAKCYAGLIMEGNDGGADFSIDDAGKSTLLRNMFNLNCLPTDEAICWWSDGGIVNLSYNQQSSGDLIVKFPYYRLISNIGFCNHYIELFSDQDPTMLAEVRFLRAYNYYMMLDFYGDPSFTTTISPDPPKQAHAYNPNYVEGNNYSRAELLALGREFLFNWVMSEIEEAEPYLLDPRPKTDSDPDYGRIDKAAAWLLMSRMYLNAGTYLNNDGQDNPYWSDALKYAEKVINSGYQLFDDTKKAAVSATLSADAQTEYDKYRPYDLLFMGDNGSNGASCEAILPLKQDGITTQGWGGSMFFIAAMWNNNMKTVTDKSAGTTANDWSGMRARPQLLEKFTSNPSLFVDKTAKEIRELNIDDRALFYGVGHTLELGANTDFDHGIPTVKWNNNYSTGGTPHDSYSVDGDFFLFRIAEAYLNAAEAEMHINGVTSEKAKRYIDAIRNRAHAAVKSSYTLSDVLDERAREFYFEGYRRVDLVRFNKYGGQDNYNWDYKNGVEDGSSKIKFDKTRNLFPLYADEIMANSNLTQIVGY